MTKTRKISLSFFELAEQLKVERKIRRYIEANSEIMPLPPSAPIPDHEFPESLVAHTVAGHLVDYTKKVFEPYDLVEVKGQSGTHDITIEDGHLSVKAVVGLKTKPKIEINEKESAAEKLWIVDFRPFISENSYIELHPTITKDMEKTPASDLLVNNPYYFQASDFIRDFSEPPYPFTPPGQTNFDCF